MLKLTKASAQAVAAPDSSALTYPAGDWVVGFVIRFDGATADGTDSQYILSNGAFASAGSLNIAWQPTTATTNAGKFTIYRNTDVATAPAIASANTYSTGTRLFVLQHTAAGAMTLRSAPILSSNPADGSAVVVEGSATQSGALDGNGALTIGGRTDLISTRFCDQSLGRLFRYDGVLTDLEVAKLAYGMEITDLSHTPTWYCRLTSNTDFADRGSSGTPFALINSPATSAEPAYGYNASPATAVTLSGPTSGVVGAAQTYTIGTNGTTTGSTTANLTASPSGTWSPTSVTFASGATATATYTPVAAGSMTLTASATGLTSAVLTMTANASSSGFDQTKVLFSPFNWLIGAGTAKTINEGAYLRFGFTGASCTLGFDISSTSTPRPKMAYRVDQGPWVAFDLTASQALTVPTESAAWAQHFVEVRVVQTSEANSKWSPQNTAVILNGITLASGGALTAKPAPRNGPTVLWYGDSTAIGINTYSNSGDATVRGSAMLAFTVLALDDLGVEYGLVGFGGQGFQTAGGGTVPALTTTYPLLWSGQARSFAEPPDYIVISEGNNDSANPQNAMVTVLNGLLAATPRSTTIIMMGSLRNIWVNEAQAAIAACSTPARVKFFLTTGFFNTANSSDGRHPYGWENLLNIAPKILEALRPIVQPVKGVRTLRSISLTLTQDAAGLIPAADAAGLVWSVFDQTSPSSLSVAADQGANASINGGMLNLQVYSTKPSGGQVYLVLATADGTKAFKGLVTLL